MDPLDGVGVYVEVISHDYIFARSARTLVGGREKAYEHQQGQRATLTSGEK